MDAPLAANSGHQGTAMALAPLAHVLFSRVMNYDPADPALARPRSLRPLQRPRVDPAVHHAVPVGCRPRTRRPAQLPPVGVADTWAPRGRAHRRRRGDHRAARAGLRQLGRHGDRRAQPANSLRRRRPGPLHLRHRRRRLHDGGHQPRGRIARGAPRAGTPDLRVRRQPHHHRRRDRSVHQRRHRRPVPGVQLGRRRARRDRRTTSTCSRPHSSRQRRRPTSHRCSCCARTSATRHQTSKTTTPHTATPSRRPMSRAPRPSWVSPTSRSGRPTSWSPPAGPTPRHAVRRRTTRGPFALHRPRRRPSGRPRGPPRASPAGTTSFRSTTSATPWRPARRSRRRSTPRTTICPASCRVRPT